MANVIFNTSRGEYLKGNIDVVNDTLKLAFMDPSYTPNVDTHVFWSDVSSDQASGTSSQTLANVSVTVDNGNDRAEVDADDVSVADETTSTDKYVVYKDTGNAATSHLLVCVDIDEGTLNPVNGTLSVTFDTEGIYAI